MAVEISELKDLVRALAESQKLMMDTMKEIGTVKSATDDFLEGTDDTNVSSGMKKVWPVLDERAFAKLDKLNGKANWNTWSLSLIHI